ncbi:TetR/AcrR family transcriptional regulator C-terminal domain-containing protein [Amycolatopsis sp. CA-230715]|uniref:TetR/AcrR family transcriptional regulator C-terminal domain-containing protein n=1 Tax=Amycolatopsis sp. CA-230715 TaxID=2745196 RepID=UPI001C038086|nr:TetR/AcrR family transcriptional regulator C-terminal domain-containing protein [Amycolatopsis sp. CA-230715]QWF83214.1 Tetracycline repressor protein class G [Amycolatopsis sp. CA-230715]
MALSRQDIARAGLRLLNDVGLNGLTLRLIAQELGVKAPALYWHMKNKQELLDEMATQMYRDREDLAAFPDGGWDDVLTERARGLRRMMLAYRDGAKVFAGTFFTDQGSPNEEVVRFLVGQGFDPARVGRAIFTVYTYVVGFTIEEQAVYPLPGQVDERYPARMEALAERIEPPMLAVVTSALPLGDPEGQFEDGLAIVLAGIRVWLAH